ncbi:hypothetical protein NZ698_05325 [Chryseobacterium sp. PBS4-4]|uniref:Uncharacterized protein n=1 Tax=Chryseobacterium edaphi TaxID=2976532 RepID=A0ABT2W7E1_9FLAO|nr:hypothetical protein [Chryseobacterium edaphi]MCU7616610.1 hypothetical protein [Chryseobacterium edaphi]
MKKLLKITTTFAIVLFSQNAFSQEKENIPQENLLNLFAENTKRNIKEKTITYDGKVNYRSKFISFDDAEKVVIDEKTSTMKIFNCKNFKIIEVKTLTKPAKKENDFIIYNYKENTLTL